MSFKPHSIRMEHVQDTNAREEKKLSLFICGHAGLEEQRRIKAQRSNRESDLLRRELADMYFKARGKKIAKREKALCEANANLLMMKEREALRRSKNRRLLNRAKQKDKLMEDLVKDFISKLENEANSKSPSSKLSEDVNDVDKKTNEPGSSRIWEEVPIYRSPSDLWEKARNTRFIRTRVLRDFEIELSSTEIFQKSVEL